MIQIPLAIGLSVLVLGGIKVLSDGKDDKKDVPSKKPKNKDVGKDKQRKNKGKSKKPVSKLPEKVTKPKPEKESEENGSTKPRGQHSDPDPRTDTGKSKEETRPDNTVPKYGSVDGGGETNENTNDNGGGNSGVPDLQENGELENDKEDNKENVE